jgi:exosortase D (VPLPA-CTERM-specific)
MFPIPHFLYNRISLKLQLISSQLGVALIQLSGMTAYREGNVIDLGFTQLQVVQACSGLRYLISLVVLGLLLAYFFRARFWKRLILVLSTIPLAILANSIRIALTGILYKYVGPKIAEGFFHDFSGWFIFMFALSLLLPGMWLLKKILPDEADLPSERKKSAAQMSPKDIQQNTPFNAKGKSNVGQILFISNVILLGLTLIISYGVNFRERVPIKKSFDAFPLQIGEWVGIRETMEQQYIDELDLSDYVIVDYKNPQGKSVNFYVAYYESQRKGESIHSPATCLLGGGWIFKEAGAQTIDVPVYNKSSMQVNRAFMEKQGQKQLAYYWFLQRGRNLTNPYQLKFFAFWDALIKQRTDGALIRLITPVYESDSLEQAEKRLQNFTRHIVPCLEEYIPGRDIL